MPKIDLTPPEGCIWRDTRNELDFGSCHFAPRKENGEQGQDEDEDVSLQWEPANSMEALSSSISISISI